MWIAITSVAALLLIVLSCLGHYEILTKTARAMHEHQLVGRKRILSGIAAVFGAHLLSVLFYAIAYFLMVNLSPDGTLAGEFRGNIMDFVYFSIMSYTTLGVGDIYPIGPIRIISGLQALNGFVMIGWSTSFTYWMVRDSWNMN